MAALSPTDAVLRVLEALGRVSGDTQLPADAIIRRQDDEYRRLRRRLASEFPTIYETLAAPFTVAAGASSFTKATDCETIRVLEKQTGSATWYPLDVAASLNRDEAGRLSFYEVGSTIYITPAPSAPGTYRYFYLAMPPTTVTTYDVPNGLEGIIIEETAAWARVRHDEDPTPHKLNARQIWDDAYMGLYNRYGSHGQSGLNQTRD